MTGVPPNGCSQRARLDDYLSRELSPQALREIEGHLAACSQCTAELAARARVRAHLQAAVRATPVPAGLDSRVRASVRAERVHPRTGIWAVAAAAAIIMCITLFNVWRGRTGPEETILRKTSGRLAAVMNVGLRDHLECAVFRKYSKQPEPASQISAGLGPEFAALAPLIQAKLPPDFRIIQAHQCRAGSRMYTHFIISGGGKVASVILTKKLPNEFLSGGIYQQGVDRFQVVGFESHDYLAYVISDLDAQQNLQMAANVAPALRQFLGGQAW